MMGQAIRLFVICGLMISCQDGSQFSSNAKDRADAIAAANVEASPGLDDAIVTELDASTVDEFEVLTPISVIDLAEDEQMALDECISAWPDHPFSQAELMQPKLANVKREVANGEVIYSDRDRSTKPQLKLVVIDVKVGNGARIELMDRQGWTCLYFKAMVVNNLRINQICDSKLAIVSFDARNANNFSINEVCPNP